jgi:hypothetical protein
MKLSDIEMYIMKQVKESQKELTKLSQTVVTDEELQAYLDYHADFAPDVVKLTLIESGVGQ